MPAAKIQTDAPSIFISYSRRDAEAADAVVSALEARGMQAFIDRRDLPYGEEWQGELSDNIAGADTVIWLVSPDSVASKWCNWELDEVQRQHKRLVPVRVGAVRAEDLPRQLGAIHILPAEGEFALERHVDTLVDVLLTDRAWIKEHTRLLDRAGQWLAKERADGLLLRGRALVDAETWQTKQPRRAPPPSPEVLDLILTSQTRAKRRQHTLVGSLAAGLAMAVGLAGLAFWQSQVAAAESKRVVRATTLSGWRTFEDPPEACLAMKKYTGEEGLRSLYCRLRGTLGYGQIERMAGMPVFLSGPHGGGKLKVRENTFGHYNPEFVTWVEANLLPQASDAEYIAVTRPIFDQFLRQQARAYQRAYVAWSRNLPHFDHERQYLLDMVEGRRPWSYLGARFQADTMRTILDIDPEREQLNWYHLDTALRFWQRRSIDGTADEFFKALESLLMRFDSDWLAAAPRPAGSPPHLPPPGSPITQVRDPAKAWLPEPSGTNDTFNDEMVID